MTFEQTFETRTAPYRRELLQHCYRMSGSIHDAEDLLQETMVRACRAFDRHDETRASLRTWLYRIATNTCLTELKNRARRPLPSGLVARGEDPEGALVRGGEVPWLQPFPDDPATVAGERGSLRLALIAALQFLPAKQRAVLILRDVLDWSAAEVATALQVTPAAVNSALQRARAKLADTGLAEDDVLEPDDPRSRQIVEKYIAAFEQADVGAFAELLTADVVLEMPPFYNWYAGREDHLRFVARVFALRGTDWRVFPIAANGQAGIAVYRGEGDVHRLHTLHVFTITAAGISHNRVFQDEAVFAAFGLALTL
ncbi:sigma-70 family RNA polymerase sigma factor [Kribbella sp. NBC_00889]|uniref:sigma-70 family RNA polymerase sigma factor n=1 Tax=Kribbella sp. NBC_00889 TaxID=2975974 RepID=UPI00386B3AA5|nr:sigma-70 family RNA polymerase sigma factor [Kribbella sp. NBC_00889]